MGHLLNTRRPQKCLWRTKHVLCTRRVQIAFWYTTQFQKESRPQRLSLNQKVPDCTRQIRGGVELLTQLVGGCDNVSGNTRVQIGVHDAERVQLGHVVPSDLQGATTAQSPPGTGGEGEGRGGKGGGEGGERGGRGMEAKVEE